MLYESLNGPTIREKNFAERVDEDLEMREQADIEEGKVFTSKTGLNAFFFYRDHAWLRQKKKPVTFKPKTLTVINERKKYVIS